MLFLLRKIRQKLVADNKVKSYLLYAVGEIILVVIGILIAVSLNNWNNHRSLQRSQETYLNALKTEFEENQKKLESAMRINNNNRTNAMKLSEAMGLTSDSISVDEIRHLVVGAISAEVQYRPRNGVIEEIISSGKLELFDDDSLRFLISGWGGELQIVRFQEKDEQELFRQKLMNTMTEYVNVKEMFIGYYENTFKLTKSKLPSQEHNRLQSLPFENHLVGFIATSIYLDYRYRNLYKAQQKLIDRITLIQ